MRYILSRRKENIPKLEVGDIASLNLHVQPEYGRIISLDEYIKVKESLKVGLFSYGYVEEKDVEKGKAVCLMKTNGSVGIVPCSHLTKTDVGTAFKDINEMYQRKIDYLNRNLRESKEDWERDISFILMEK